MTGENLIWILRSAEAFVLVIGALITFASYRAYARTREPALALLGTGFAVVSVAAALAGVLYEVTTHDLLTSWTVSATLDGAGFSLILYSIVRPRTIEAAMRDEPPAPDEGAPNGA